MTKFVKMSLAAAVAVAGISTTASAMENTTFSGKLYVENIVKTSDASNSTTDGDSIREMEIDFDVQAKTKITDNLSSVVRFEADAGTAESAGTTSTPTADLENAYFTYADMGAAVNMGRLYVDTPNTDGDVAEGLFATYTAGPVTVAVADYATNSLVTNGINAAAILGAAGPVNFEAWLVNIDAHSANTTFVVGGDFGPVSAELRSANTDYDAVGTKDGSTMKAVVSAKVGMVGLTGIYFTTDKDGGAYVTDASSANAVELVNLVSYKSGTIYSDATVTALVATIPAGDAGTVALKYGTGEVSNDVTKSAFIDVSEYVFQYTHKLAKSTSASFRYAGYNQDVTTAGGAETDMTHARVDLTYKF